MTATCAALLTRLTQWPADQSVTLYWPTHPPAEPSLVPLRCSPAEGITYPSAAAAYATVWAIYQSGYAVGLRSLLAVTVFPVGPFDGGVLP